MVGGREIQDSNPSPLKIKRIFNHFLPLVLISQDSASDLVLVLDFARIVASDLVLVLGDAETNHVASLRWILVFLHPDIAYDRQCGRTPGCRLLEGCDAY